MNENVTVGWATRAAAILVALTGVAPLVGELADASKPLGVQPAVWVIVSASIACLTILGRMVQAVAKILRAGAPTDGGLETGELVDLVGEPTSPALPTAG